MLQNHPLLKKLFGKLQKFPRDFTAGQMNPLCRYAPALAALILVAYVPLLFISQWPGRDVAGRYAPMAEAFAAGDFLYAFHPRCQMLHTSIAGIIVYLTSCTGYMACKLAGFLFFLLSLFPFYAVMKRIFGISAARGALLLFVCCIPVVNLLAASGERDSAKMFIQLLLTYSITEIFFDREKLHNYLLLGITGGLAVCTRSDLLFIVILFLFFCGLLDRDKHKFCWRTLLGLAAAVLVSSLELFTNWFVTGYVIPGTRFYYLIEEFFKREPSWSIWYFYICIPCVLLFIFSVCICHFLRQKRCGRKILLFAGAAAVLALVAGGIYLSFKPASDTADYLQSIAEGISPLYFPVAAIVIFFRIREKKWTSAEGLLLGIFLVLDLAVLLQIAISDKRLFLSPRYIIPALPLLLGWCWLFCCNTGRFLAEEIPFMRNRIFLLSLLGAAILLVLFLGYRKEINLRSRSNDVKHLFAIREISRLLQKEKIPQLRLKPNIFYYCSTKRPFVLFDCPARLAPAAYLGGGSTASFYTPVDILVTDASKQEWQVRMQFIFQGALIKYGEPIPFGKTKLQLWKHIIP